MPPHTIPGLAGKQECIRNASAAHLWPGWRLGCSTSCTLLLMAHPHTLSAPLLKAQVMLPSTSAMYSKNSDTTVWLEWNAKSTPSTSRNLTPPNLDPADDAACLLQDEKGGWHLKLMGAGHTAQDLLAPTYLAAETVYPPHYTNHAVDLQCFSLPASLCLPTSGRRSSSPPGHLAKQRFLSAASDCMCH